jgi:biofilm PGA synthesis N-glycosyltransferase PgaC
MWPTVLESTLSLLWVVAWALALLVAAIAAFVPSWHTLFGLAISWGVAISVVCVAQAAFALSVRARHDIGALRVFLLGPLYPLFFWLISALAALRSELPALIKGPRESRVVWDIERDPADSSATATTTQPAQPRGTSPG